MARIFVEIIKDADPFIIEMDWEVAFNAAPSLDSDKLHIAEQYESWRGNRRYALDYYATSDFSEEAIAELKSALVSLGIHAELEIEIDAGWPSPGWHYRVMETDYR